MRPSSALALAAVLLCAAPALCGLDASVLMEYAHEAGVEAQVRVSGKLLGVEMGGGIAMAVTASSQVDVTLRVVEVDEQGVATVRASFGKITSEFMGQQQENGDVEPFDLKIDKHGRVVETQAGEGEKFDILAAGGMPRQIIAMLGAAVELPQEPVAPGEAWTIEHAAGVPDMGQVTLTVSSQLDSLDSDSAVITTSIWGDLPDFTAQNPIQEGDIEVTQGKVTVEQMRRTVSLASGLVQTAQGQMTFDCRANLPGVGEVPLKVNTSFEITPLPAQEQARHGAAREAEPASMPRTASAPPPRQNAPATLYARTAEVVVGYVLELVSRGLGWWRGL
jgi:hypothetical protein